MVVIILSFVIFLSLFNCKTHSTNLPPFYLFVNWMGMNGKTLCICEPKPVADVWIDAKPKIICCELFCEIHNLLFPVFICIHRCVYRAPHSHIPYTLYIVENGRPVAAAAAEAAGGTRVNDNDTIQLHSICKMQKGILYMHFSRFIGLMFDRFDSFVSCMTVWFTETLIVQSTKYKSVQSESQWKFKQWINMWLTGTFPIHISNAIYCESFDILAFVKWKILKIEYGLTQCQASYFKLNLIFDFSSLHFIEHPTSFHASCQPIQKFGYFQFESLCLTEKHVSKLKFRI